MASILSNTEIVEAIGLPEDIVEKITTAEGTEFAAVANEFINAIVNKIVYQKVESMEFDNPFKQFDSFPVKYGDTIENIYVDKVMGNVFNKDATDPFVKSPANVKTLYAKINYEMQYPITIQDSLLRRAALNEYGFMDLINKLLGSLVTARSVDEYLATIISLNNEDIYANGFEEIDVSDLETDKEKYAAITKKIVNVYHDFALPSIDNNKAGVLAVTKPENTLLIIKQSLLDAIDLDYLTGLFNLSKVDMMKRIIPVRSFQCVVNTTNTEGEPGVISSLDGEDLDFVILDSRGFDNHVALQDGGMIYNPRGKYTNHYSNLWKIIGFKFYHQARAFKVKYTASAVEPTPEPSPEPGE